MDNWYSPAASGQVVTFNNWNELIGDVHMSPTDVSGNVKNLMNDYIASSEANTRFMWSSAAISRFADSSNIKGKYVHSGVTLNAVSANNFAVADKIYHIGDSDTHIKFSPDQIRFSGGGVEFLRMLEGGADTITFNFGQRDIDLVVQGSSQTNLLKVDANLNQVGIMGAPEYTLDVNGSIQADTSISSAIYKASSYISSQAGLYSNFVSSNSVRVGKIRHGGNTHIDFDSKTTVTVNPDGNNMDFVVEGDDDTSLIYVDATSDRVGISTAIPSYKLDVNGTIHSDTAISSAGKIKAESHISSATGIYADWVSSNTGTGTGYWTQTGSDIYYDTGEVRVGHSTFDVGNYKFQVSGASYFSGNVTFLGTISGIAAPTYNSGAANKKYVDDTASNERLNYKGSSSVWVYASSQYLSGQLRALHTARDIAADKAVIGWDSVAFNNSGLIWDHDNQWWEPMPSGGITLTNLDEVVIDVHKDWGDYGIRNLDHISSQAISGGSYMHIAMPADYIIDRDGDDYYARNGRTGSIDYQSNVANTLVQDVIGATKSGTIYCNTDMTFSAGISGHKDIVLDLGGHRITSDGPFNVITICQGFGVQNGAIDLSQGSYTNNKAAIYCSGTWCDTSDAGYNYPKKTYLKNINIMGEPYGTTQVGAGIYLELPVAALRHISFFNFENITIANTYYGIRMQIPMSNYTNSTYINGNNFDNIHITTPVHGIWISANSASNKNEIQGNLFTNVHLQWDLPAYNNTRNLLYLGPRVYDNKIDGYFWDTPAGGTTLEIHPSSAYNVITGYNLEDDHISNPSGAGYYKLRNTIKNATGLNLSTGIFSLSSNDYIHASDISKKTHYAMTNFPLIVENPNSEVGNTTGIGFSVQKFPWSSYENWSPGATITAENVGTRNALKLHLAAKAEVGTANYWVPSPTMTIYSSNVGINCTNPTDYRLIVSGNILTRGGSISSQAISGGSLTIGDTISEIRTGWASVADAGTIAHGCSSKPVNVSLAPSGTSPIAYSFKVDASDITVYHTAEAATDFSWSAMV